jgi:hypothetical protein
MQRFAGRIGLPQSPPGLRASRRGGSPRPRRVVVAVFVAVSMMKISGYVANSSANTKNSGYVAVFIANSMTRFLVAIGAGTGARRA